MSEQGADKAGKDIATGLRFLFKSCGLAICIGVILWLLPDLITAIRWW
ncbi:hypothetical protein ACLSZ3_04510 [Avibacterium gallinarum]